MRKSKPPRKSGSPVYSRALTDEILAHVDRFSVTTQNAVAALFMNGDRREAGLVLQAMDAAGQLKRIGRLYANRRRKLSEAELRQRYGALWFTCLATPKRPVLSTEQLVDFTQPITDRYRLPPVRNALCYLDQSKRRLALIRVQPPPRGNASDLQRVLGRLQSQVDAEPFKLWSYLAMSGGFVMTFLMWNSVEAREFSLWLRRRPLVSRLVSPWVEIPVIVRRTRLPP